MENQPGILGPDRLYNWRHLATFQNSGRCNNNLSACRNTALLRKHMQGVQLLSLQTRWRSRARRHPKALTSAACGMEAWKTKSTAQTPWTRSPAPLAPKAGHLHPARVLTSAGFRRSHRLVLCRGLRRAVAWNRVIPIPFLVQGLRVGRRNHHSMRATHGTRRRCC